MIVCQLTPWTSRIEALVRQKDYNQAIHVVRASCAALDHTRSHSRAMWG